MTDAKRVCILDYGSGNTKSVFNMLDRIGVPAVISCAEEDLIAASHLMLPGVGAFGAAMAMIRDRIPLPLLERLVLEEKKPFLGICLGMQVLADKGYEFGETEGLGWIGGEVSKLDSGTHPLPHVGWNSLRLQAPDPLTRDLKEDAEFYFVHSYAFRAEDEGHVLAKADYGSAFAAIVGKGNIYGVQFHPEKSQRAGMLLISNFLNLK